MIRSTGDITAMLTRVSRGDGQAVDSLFPLVYDELRGLANRALVGERRDHTLQATALVHEVYLKLIGQQSIVWRDRAHFHALASQAIRRILVDHARTRNRDKRGGSRERVSLQGDWVPAPQPGVDLIALDEALRSLAVDHPRKALVVEMRFFGGMTVGEVAEVLGVDSRSVERDWQFARAWLFRALSERMDGGVDAVNGA